MEYNKKLAKVEVHTDVSDFSYIPGYAVIINENQIEPVIFSTYMNDISKHNIQRERYVSG